MSSASNTGPATTTTVPPVGTILYDAETSEAYLRVVAVDETGVTTRRDGIETFVPHNAFAPWDDPTLRTATELDSTRAETDSGGVRSVNHAD